MSWGCKALFLAHTWNPLTKHPLGVKLSTTEPGGGRQVNLCPLKSVYSSAFRIKDPVSETDPRPNRVNPQVKATLVVHGQKDSLCLSHQKPRISTEP